MEEKIIGVIRRFNRNDYQISLVDYSEEDQRKLQEIEDEYSDLCSCERGDENLTIKAANVECWEKAWTEQTRETARKELAKKGDAICKNDWGFYDDREGKWFDEDEMYEALGTASGCAYFIETVLPAFDGSEETKCYLDLTMDIINYMEMYF